jgi:hypothetical protein
VSWQSRFERSREFRNSWNPLGRTGGRLLTYVRRFRALRIRPGIRSLVVLKPAMRASFLIFACCFVLKSAVAAQAASTLTPNAALVQSVHDVQMRMRENLDSNQNIIAELEHDIEALTSLLEAGSLNKTDEIIRPLLPCVSRSEVERHARERRRNS